MHAMAAYRWRLVVPTMGRAGNPIGTALLQHIADKRAAAFGGVTMHPEAEWLGMDTEVHLRHGLGGPGLSREVTHAVHRLVQRDGAA